MLNTQIIFLISASWIALSACQTQNVAEHSPEYSERRIEGDILVTSELRSTMEAMSNPNNPFSPQNAAIRFEQNLWPDGVIPYTMNGNMNSAAMSAITAAMNDYKTMTCITFKPRTNEEDYVYFSRGNGCYSYIGRIGGPQEISIGNGCEFKGIVIHEIFHTLGRWHEQSRTDRDQFVKILPENIKEGTEGNFRITNSAFATTQAVPYDLGSVMHYKARAFSKNGQPTIVPVDPSIPLSALGQRDGFTATDLLHVRTLYNCPSVWSAWSPWTNCSQSCNTGQRTRTRSCVGGTSCNGSNIETESCFITACPQPSSWGAWGTWSACSASCGGGRQNRVRSCVDGTDCLGASSEFRNCSESNCPEPAVWASWSSWSTCNSTCEGGIRHRQRRCLNGNTCPGSDMTTEDCNTGVPCETTNPNSGEWTSWSKCSVQCGGGTRSRVRQCGGINCEAESEDCNTEACKQGLVDYGCTALDTGNSNLRVLASGKNLNLDQVVSTCGKAAIDYGLSLFGVAAGYCLVTLRDNIDDLLNEPAPFCTTGTGAYVDGFYYISVYEILDPTLFSDSVVQLNSTDATTTVDVSYNGTDNEMAENGNRTEPVDDDTFASSGSKLVQSIITVLISSGLTVVLVMAMYS